MLSLESVKNDLTFIQSHFFILVKSIKNVERSSLTLCDSIQIVNNVILAMEKVPGQQGKIIQEKLLYLIEKNVGFQTAKQITAILSGIEYNLCIDEMSLNNLRTGTMTRFRRLCARQHVKVGHTKCQNV
ncbi:hypothetical protein QTP88_002071 [Uroleucon formosanum]